ncbi:MAG: right-handed parallel beta-helix repeat-containing protein [Actinomycetota bacterium]
MKAPRAVSLVALALIAFAIVGATPHARAVVPACGDIADSFTLTADQTCAGDGWTVIADDVDIDLNGFSLLGNGTGTGITFTGQRRVTIRNGTIEGFQLGIEGINANGALLQKVAVVRNAGPGMSVAAPKAIAKRITATGNGSNGINFYGEQISDSTASNNGGTGIATPDFTPGIPDRLLVTNNVAAGNNAGGFFANDNNVTMQGNSAIGNASAGITIDAATSSVKLKSNTSSGNEGHGIRVENGALDVVIKNNITHGNGWPDPTNVLTFRGIQVDTPVSEVSGSGNKARGNNAGLDCSGGPIGMCKPPGTSKADLSTDAPDCEEPITHSFKLTANVGPCPTKGWTFDTTRDITIDLNGFRLRGNSIDDAGTEIGIDIGGTKRVTIRNGVVEGFGFGIASGQSVTDFRLSNVVVVDTQSTGAEVHAVGDSSIKRLVSVGSGVGHGLLGGAPVVDRVITASNAFVGHVSGTGTDDSQITGSFSASNGENGFEIFAKRVKLDGVRALGNTLSGIEVEGSRARITGANASGNELNGVTFTGDSENSFVRSSNANGNGWPTNDGTGGGIISNGSPVSGGLNVAYGNDGVDCTDPIC